MDIARQRLTVRHFYEENSANLFEAIHNERARCFAPAFEEIAVVSIGELSPFEVWIRRNSQSIPQPVSKAFSRHLWYSQWNFAGLKLVKVAIDAESFFLLFHTGISDDDYDNQALFVEIFNEQGDFMGAPNYIYGNEVLVKKWSDEQVTHKDCRVGRTREITPPLPEDDSDATYYDLPLWTEDATTETIIETETSIEIKENEDGTTTTISYLRKIS